jgi:hypothetical protein
MRTSNFIPVDKLKILCPCCQRKQYCMATPDLSAVICRRPSNKHIAHNYVPKETKKAIEGVLYVLRDELSTLDTYHPPLVYVPEPVEKPDADFTEYAKTAYGRTDRKSFASSLGVSVESCDSIRVGYTSYCYNNKIASAYTIPMRNELLKIIGIRLRFGDGQKRAIKGSSAGFVCRPTLTHSKDILFVCEGESDLLSALDMGIVDVVAKPGRLAADKYIIKYLKDGIERIGARRPIVLVSDNDRDGYEGALRSAKLYEGLCSWCKVIIPPAKDLRAWYNSGKADKDKMHYLVNNTKPYKYS